MELFQKGGKQISIPLGTIISFVPRNLFLNRSEISIPLGTIIRVPDKRTIKLRSGFQFHLVQL